MLKVILRTKNNLRNHLKKLSSIASKPQTTPQEDVTKHPRSPNGRYAKQDLLVNVVTLMGK